MLKGSFFEWTKREGTKSAQVRRAIFAGLMSVALIFSAIPGAAFNGTFVEKAYATPEVLDEGSEFLVSQTFTADETFVKDYTIPNKQTVTVVAKKLTIAPGKTLTIASGGALEVSGPASAATVELVLASGSATVAGAKIVVQAGGKLTFTGNSLFDPARGTSKTSVADDGSLVVQAGGTLTISGGIDKTNKIVDGNDGRLILGTNSEFVLRGNSAEAYSLLGKEYPYKTGNGLYAGDFEFVIQPQAGKTGVYATLNDDFGIAAGEQLILKDGVTFIVAKDKKLNVADDVSGGDSTSARVSGNTTAHVYEYSTSEAYFPAALLSIEPGATLEVSPGGSVWAQRLGEIRIGGELAVSSADSVHIGGSGNTGEPAEGGKLSIVDQGMFDLGLVCDTDTKAVVLGPSAVLSFSDGTLGSTAANVWRNFDFVTFEATGGVNNARLIYLATLANWYTNVKVHAPTAGDDTGIYWTTHSLGSQGVGKVYVYGKSVTFEGTAFPATKEGISYSGAGFYPVSKTNNVPLPNGEVKKISGEGTDLSWLEITTTTGDYVEYGARLFEASSKKYQQTAPSLSPGSLLSDAEEQVLGSYSLLNSAQGHANELVFAFVTTDSIVETTYGSTFPTASLDAVFNIKVNGTQIKSGGSVKPIWGTSLTSVEISRKAVIKDIVEAKTDAATVEALGGTNKGLAIYASAAEGQEPNLVAYLPIATFEVVSNKQLLNDLDVLISTGEGVASPGVTLTKVYDETTVLQVPATGFDQKYRNYKVDIPTEKDVVYISPEAGPGMKIAGILYNGRALYLDATVGAISTGVPPQYQSQLTGDASCIGSYKIPLGAAGSYTLIQIAVEAPNGDTDALPYTIEVFRKPRSSNMYLATVEAASVGISEVAAGHEVEVTPQATLNHLTNTYNGTDSYGSTSHPIVIQVPYEVDKTDKLQLKLAPLFNAKITNVALGNTGYSDGDKDGIWTADNSVSIATGSSNVLRVDLQSEDYTYSTSNVTKAVIFTVSREAQSANARLGGVGISWTGGGDTQSPLAILPDFDPAEEDYIVYVSGSATSVNFASVKAENDNAHVSIEATGVATAGATGMVSSYTATFDATNDKTRVTVYVSPEVGQSKIYTFNVIKDMGTISTLGTLSLYGKSVLSSPLTTTIPDTLISREEATATFTLSAQAPSAKIASITKSDGTGTLETWVASNGGHGEQTFTVTFPTPTDGKDVAIKLSIVVEAANGTRTTYAYIVKRQFYSTANALANLVVNAANSDGTASTTTLPLIQTKTGASGFDPSVNEYTLVLPENVSGAIITPTKQYSYQSTSISPPQVVYWRDKGESKDVEVAVIPSSSEATSNTYTIHLSRAAATSPNLTNLVVTASEAGTSLLTTAFSPTTTNYNTKQVAYSESVVLIVGKPENGQVIARLGNIMQPAVEYTADLANLINEDEVIIRIPANSLKVGANILTISSYPQDGDVSEKAYTVTLNKLDKSNDASLKTYQLMTVSGAAITLHAVGADKWTATVPATTDAVLVKAVANSIYAKGPAFATSDAIEEDGPAPPKHAITAIAEGDAFKAVLNKVSSLDAVTTILYATVEAENGDVREFLIDITRERELDHNNYLGALVVTPEGPTYQGEPTVYELKEATRDATIAINVSTEAQEVNLLALADSKYATLSLEGGSGVYITPTDVDTNGGVYNVELGEPGTTTQFKVKVVPDDGITPQAVTVKITRLPQSSLLTLVDWAFVNEDGEVVAASDESVSGYNDTTKYLGGATLEYTDASTLTLVATADSALSTIFFKRALETTYTLGQTMDFKVGLNKIFIDVDNGNISTRYTLNLYRKSLAELSLLTAVDNDPDKIAAGIDLIEDFSPTNREYTITVPAGTGSVYLNAAGVAGATITAKRTGQTSTPLKHFPGPVAIAAVSQETIEISVSSALESETIYKLIVKHDESSSSGEAETVPTIKNEAGPIDIAKVGEYYSYLIEAETVATVPVADWEAAGLPAGLALVVDEVNSNVAYIQGTPEGAGEAAIKVWASNAIGDSPKVTFNLTIEPEEEEDPTTPTIITEGGAIPEATAGEYYSYTIEAEAGETVPVTAWSADGLPAGLELVQDEEDSNIAYIQGTPEFVGEVAIVVTASNLNGDSLPVTYILTVVEPSEEPENPTPEPEEPGEVTDEPVDPGEVTPDYTGWVEVDDSYYYYVAGELVKDKWFSVEGPFNSGQAKASRYFTSSGKLAGGWTDITSNGKTDKYYFWYSTYGSTYAKGLQKNLTAWSNGEEGRTYYFDNDGKMQTAWKYVQGSWRYFDDELGWAPIGWTNIERDGTTYVYYFWSKADGTYAKGGLTAGLTAPAADGGAKNQTYYFDSQGHRQTGFQLVKGTWYYFDDVTGIAPTLWKSIERGGETHDYYFWSTKPGLYAKNGTWELTGPDGWVASYTFNAKGWATEVEE